jgi:hypothetical protein
MDRTAIAKREAAHIVVGVTCGLRLYRATAIPALDGILGWAWFRGNPQGPHREALALMYAAGVAWEQGGPTAAGDRALLRTVCSGRHAERAFIRAADALLATRGFILDRVAAALTHRDLTGADITAIARGERIDL